MNVQPQATDWDVAIIGGGPGGSTTGTLLKKYRPTLRVLILERETFPREHIGESQLPAIGDVLAEMGCWDKVEGANFPIKVGATFRWGKNPELWDFEFLPLKDFKSDARPARYEGPRRQTAFQVERAIYDDILLRHAAETGCVVRQGTGVTRVERDGDRVTGLVLSTGETVTARYYVDASGNAAVLRRALGVGVDCPTHLKNIAIWDYWENAEWAIEIGVGGTRIQVMSLGYGWLWFIPLGPTRTSLGLVCPAEYYKAAGKSPEELYAEALRSEARISRLVANGSRSGQVRTTTDWSFLADRTIGENWFLVGECAGFADPILSAGMTLTHTGGRELAYTLLALFAGEHDPAWLTTHYDRLQRERVGQHIRFADFWYAANGQFTDLAEHCRAIARDAGLDLTAEQSWAWLARGGFATDVAGQAGLGGYSLAAVKGLTARFTDEPAVWGLNDVNVLRIDLAGATHETVPVYADGRIKAATAYRRGNHRLVATGLYDVFVQMLAQPTDVGEVVRQLNAAFTAKMTPPHARVALQHAMQTLEVMLGEGWVRGTLDPSRPRLTLSTPREGEYIHPNRDEPS
jgi:flavin-dependent dehydrogenase